jgi:uncharacterized NAD-dependent epimerase/dehydratase family protein
MVVLTQGHSEPVTAKTATCLVRYRPEEVVALLDSTQAGKTTQDVLGVGGDIPFVSCLEEAPDANVLAVGIAPPGGKIPAAWRSIILEAIARRMDVVSGLHEFLCRDPEFAAAAQASGSQLIDVRKNNESSVASRQGWRDECLRIHTVGHDCSIGKMLVAVELTEALRRDGVDAKFIATGQTGIMVEGDGCPVDCVVSDFLSGAVEKQILANQHREVLIVEGQGSISHPRYSAVTLGLLHGCLPHGLILCYEVGRTQVNGMEPIPLKSLPELRTVYETLANLMFPCRVIGVAMNSRNVTREQADEERERVRAEMQLPVCDVIRHGPEELVAAIRSLGEERCA